MLITTKKVLTGIALSVMFMGLASIDTNSSEAHKSPKHDHTSIQNVNYQEMTEAQKAEFTARHEQKM